MTSRRDTKRLLQMRLLERNTIVALTVLLHKFRLGFISAATINWTEITGAGLLIVFLIHETEVQSFVPFPLPRLSVVLVRSLLLNTHHLPLTFLLLVQVSQDLPLHQDRGQ